MNKIEARQTLSNILPFDKEEHMDFNSTFNGEIIQDVDHLIEILESGKEGELVLMAYDPETHDSGYVVVELGSDIWYKTVSPIGINIKLMQAVYFAFDI